MNWLFLTVKEFYNNIRLLLNEVFREFGFDSTWGFFKNTFLLDVKYSSVYLISVVSAFFITLWDYLATNYFPFKDYVEIHVYNPLKGITLLFVITIVDIWVGTTKARSNRTINGEKPAEKVEGSKFLRSFVRFSVQVFFVSFLFNLNLVYGFMAIEWVVHVLMIAFIIATYISAWNNAHEIGWINKETHQFIMDIFDLRKLFNIFRNKYNRNDG